MTLNWFKFHCSSRSCVTSVSSPNLALLWVCATPTEVPGSYGCFAPGPGLAGSKQPSWSWRTDFKRMLKIPGRAAFLSSCQVSSTLFFGWVRIPESRVFHYVFLIVKEQACWNAGEVFGCACCHNSRVKRSFPSAGSATEHSSSLPSSVKAWDRGRATHRQQNEWNNSHCCTQIWRLNPNTRESDAGSTWEQLGQMNNSIGCHEEQIKQLTGDQAARVTDTLIRKSKADWQDEKLDDMKNGNRRNNTRKGQAGSACWQK